MTVDWAALAQVIVPFAGTGGLLLGVVKWRALVKIEKIKADRDVKIARIENGARR